MIRAAMVSYSSTVGDRVTMRASKAEETHAAVGAHAIFVRLLIGA